MNREGKRKNYKNYRSKEEKTERRNEREVMKTEKKKKKTVTSNNIRCIRDCYPLNRFVCDLYLEIFLSNKFGRNGKTCRNTFKISSIKLRLV